MPHIPRSIRNYTRDAAGAFSLAPVEVVLGLLAAAWFSVALRADGMDTWAKGATAAALALPLVFGLSVLRARSTVSSGVRWAGTAAVLVAAAGYGLFVVSTDRDAEVWRFMALLGAAATALSLVPVVGVVGHERRRWEFWRFNALLVGRVVSVVAYGLALYGALAGAVAAVSSLFELKTPEHLYQDLFGAVFFALVPWVVVGGLPALAAESADEGEAPRGVRLLGRYLYAPVLVVYLAILLAYAVKVGVTGEMPKNILSPIILLAGLFGFLGSLLLEPLRRDPEHSGVSRLVRAFPAFLLVLLPLAVWAVWVRREQYGWTEFRYLRFALLLALGALAVVGTYRLVRRREPLLLLVPAVLGATLLLSAVGPWSAPAVSRRSQEARLVSGLREAGLLADGRYSGPLLPLDSLGRVSGSGDEVRTIPEPLHGQITGSVTYLYSAHGVDALKGIFPQDLSRYDSGWQLASAIPIRPGCAPGVEVQSAGATLPAGTPVPGLEGGTLYRVERASRQVPAQTASIRVQVEGAELRVSVARAEPWIARVDLRPLVERLAATGPEECAPGFRFASTALSPDEALRTLTDENGRVRGQILLTDVGIDRRSPEPRTRATRGAFQLEYASVLVIVRE